MNRGRCDGILLAAGAGTRYGMPKVLAEDGAWLRGAVHALHAGGCERVYVVLGATGPPHRALDDPDDSSLPRWQISQTHGILIPAAAQPVWASDWAAGMSASLRAGLAAVVAHPAGARAQARRIGGLPEFVAIMPVDTPDVGPEVVARVIAAARGAGSGLARAVFDGRPGHPVVIGRGHWAGVTVALTGKSGAASYLRERADMVCVTCGDVATGWDHDYPRHAHTPSGSK
ncbi:nucleotidyltransferase family protein [Nocardia otitidiscaviarum]|uniref:Nucleotidyltransferase family protein n=1 Tax=Nocardia otitidiscaviarum TaxID=1823 RepID=A0A516NVQ4_9NOCA|nr:nucleotidyltransferase family protein [Nocardia otitidiscaviarum]MCP9622479.1 nucleotidyltransferase family protein [Nocardia otitidiscaviarum]QDP82989.1 nucleotidyltransferase family protein [Nocardia otitidiscaviarum]